MVYFGLFKVFLGEKFKIGPEYDKIKVVLNYLNPGGNLNFSYGGNDRPNLDGLDFD